MRRDAALHVSDRIQVTIETTDRVEKAFDLHCDYICHEVLATQVFFKPCSNGKEWDLNGEPTKIEITWV